MSASVAPARATAYRLPVVHVPFLQEAFSTVGLGAGDWLRCAAVSGSVLWLREPSKRLARA